MKIGTICRQQYKYGFGCAEVGCKYPACLIARASQYLGRKWQPGPGNFSSIGCKRRAKRLLASYPVRSGLLRVSGVVERFVPFYGINAAFYRTAIGVFYIAGIKDGMLRFGKTST